MMLPQTTVEVKPSPYHVVIPLVLTVVAASMSFAPYQQMILLLVCDRLDITHQSTGSSPDYQTCAASDQVQSLTSWWSMILSLASNVPALFSTPIIGLASDNGRKLGMLLPVAASIVHTLGILVVAKFELSLWVLAAASLVQGSLGSFLVLQASSFAFISDCSSIDERAGLFGKIEAFTFVAFMLGPFLGGELSRLPHVGIVGVFSVCAIVLSIVFCYILFILPETIQSNDSITSQNSSVGKRFQGIFKDSFDIVSRPSVRSLSLMFFSVSVAYGGLQFIFLFTSKKFGWDSYDMGLFLLCLALTRGFYMGYLMPKISQSSQLKYPTAHLDEDQVRLMREKQVSFEMRFVRLGMLVYIMCLIANSLVITTSQFYIVGIIEGFGSISVPLVRAILSKSTSSSHQGKLFSTIALIQQSSGLVSPLIFGFLFSLTVSWWSGVLFLGIALWYAIGLVCTLFVKNSDLVQSEEESGILGDFIEE